MEASIEALEMRLRRLEQLVRSPAYMDAVIRVWRASADMSVLGVVEGETHTTVGDITLASDTTIYGDWLIANLPGGAGNAAGKTGLFEPETA